MATPLPALVGLGCLLLATVRTQNVNRVGLGFPDAWDGDKYKELYCPSKNIPSFLDGYFLCQLSAAYGNASNPPGQKLNHMIDAIGAVGAFHISNGQVLFSAEYYPSRPYKIWEFYDRNMSKSSVPWAGWSDYNLTAMSRWEQVPSNSNAARFHPNLDFWKVGNKIIAGTEAPYWVGYEFNVRSLNNFKLFPFEEANEIFGNPKPSLIPISMAIHERTDHEGTVWGSFSAMNFNEHRFFQGIFTIDTNGVRRVVGMFDYGVWDPAACGKDDEYIGDKTLLPGYIHSITSTEKYIILPITSLLINPCKFKEPPMTNPSSSVQDGGLWGMDFYDMVPIRFLVFNKRTKEWTTQKPLEVFPSMFVTHQLNAFDSPDGTIVADMVVYDSHDPYVKYFYVDFLTSQLYPSTARILRFVLDVTQQRVMYSYLIPQETIAADFPQINHKYESRAYQWAYMVVHPYAADNSILKVNVDDPTGTRNLNFKAEPSVVLHEPWFVPRPDSRREDDGVLLVRGLDVRENKGLLIVIDAITMTELGRALVPISIPFGFHNRFYTKGDLGLPDGYQAAQPMFNVGFRPSKQPVTEIEATTPPQTVTTQSWTRPTQAPHPPSTTAQPQPPQSFATKFPKWWPSPQPGSGPWLPPHQRQTPSGLLKPTSWWERLLTTTRSPMPAWPGNSAIPPMQPTWGPTAVPGPIPGPSPSELRPAPSELRPPPVMTWGPPRSQTTQPPPTPAPTRAPWFPPSPPVPNIVPNPPIPEVPVIIHDLYEETLQAMCRWMPRVFRTISDDLCVDRRSSHNFAHVVPPLANYAQHIPLQFPNPFNPEIRLADDSAIRPRSSPPSPPDTAKDPSSRVYTVVGGLRKN